MRHKITIAIICVVCAAVFFHVRFWGSRKNAMRGEITKEIQPVVGTIESTLSANGSVLPSNRLEIKPPVNGRIDRVLAQEGARVQAGDIVAWMSSTERAALLDAARGLSQAEQAQWQDAYKAIPLIAPVAGQAIVSKMQPGQTVTVADAVVVLADALIVRAQVDETDIGKISAGQAARIRLDAYPDTAVKAIVQHVYYESQTVNNVTVYEVDLLPETVPSFFRSGMSASIDFIEKSSEHALLLPQEAVNTFRNRSFVLLADVTGEMQRKEVETGMSDDKNIEILSGLTVHDTVIVKTKKYTPAKGATGTNPFMPSRRPAQSKNGARPAGGAH